MDRSRCLPFIFAAVSFPAVAPAQTARVVAADGPKVLDVTFDPPSTTQLNTDAALLRGIDSLVFRDDGADGLNLLAADPQRGKVLFYTNAEGNGAIVLDRSIQTHPLRPGALSQDVHKNLFGASSAVDSQGRSSGKIWVLLRDPACASGCLPGGYKTNVGSVDGTIEIVVTIGGVPTLTRVVSVEETRFVPQARGVLAAGDLLVLTTNPASVLRYTKPAIEAFLDGLAQGGVPTELEPEILVYPGNADVDPERRFPAGAVPSGMEFTPAGNILVPTDTGVILCYGPTGARLSDAGGFVDFASGLAPGDLKLAVGLQDGDFRAFVSAAAAGEVLRFGIQPDGRGILEDVVDAPVTPLGITTTTANVVPTPSGSNVPVQLTNLMHSTIENVETGGSTSSSVIMFEDPREAEVSIDPDQPLHRPLLLSEIRDDLPTDAVIPEYVRAFRKGDPVTGPPTFLLIVVDTNIQVQGVIDHVVDEALILGYEPDCFAPSSTAQQRLFWLPSPAEPPSLESPKFVDISTDCGTSRGKMRMFSLFLASARDTRSSYNIAKTKLFALRTVLDRALCVDPPLATELRLKIETALFHLSRRNPDASIALMHSFTAAIQANPGAFANCEINESGELRARADSAAFILAKVPVRPVRRVHW